MDDSYTHTHTLILGLSEFLVFINDDLTQPKITEIRIFWWVNRANKSRFVPPKNYSFLFTTLLYASPDSSQSFGALPLIDKK